MAKRRSKQDAGAKQDALPPFDYSPAEWSKIEEPIRAIGKSLPNNVREQLVFRARAYLVQKMEPWPEERRDWQRIARLSKSLRQAVLDRTKKDLVSLAIDLVPGELKRFRQQPEAWLKSISEIENLANEMIALPEVMHFRPARLVFQSMVLEIWTRLGGRLQFSRHPKTGKPQGPLIRFFRAVTTPVMGASAPSLESICDIVRRYRDRTAALAEMKERLAALEQRLPYEGGRASKG